MDASLRKRMLGRLLPVAIGLAAIAGGAIYFLERRSIDQRIFSLAIEQTRGLATHLGFLDEPDRPDFEQVRARLEDHVQSEHIDEGHFVSIEIYDLSRRKVVEAIHPGFLAVERAVDTKHLVPNPAEPYAHAWINLDGVSYVQVLAPLQIAGRRVAWFDGTFRVDPAVMGKMNRELAVSVLLVALVVLATALALYPILLRLNADLLRLTDDLAYANMGMLAALGSAVARRDRGTNAHNYRVTIYSIHLARVLEFNHEQIRGVIKGAFLHDVGKIGIADAILRKPGRLTPQETTVMRAHVRYGAEIVGKFEWLRDALDVVQCHHERFDGLGYPAGLVGDQIPLAARIFAVVDVFDALTTRRPYKDAIPLGDTLRTMEEERGTRFDPVVLDAFVALAPELHMLVSGADELKLTRMLDRLLIHYFPAPSGSAAARAPIRLGLAPRPAAHGGTGELALTPLPISAAIPEPPADHLGYLSGSWSLEGTGRGAEASPDPFAEDPLREDPFRDYQPPDDPSGK